MPPETHEAYKQRIIKLTDERGEFVAGNDGYYVYWIDNKGSLTSNDLRILADELDRRNADWDANVQQHVR